MEAQVESAIEIAGNPASDQTLKAQAFDFLDRLRSEPTGWRACLTLFTRLPRASEVVRHVSLEVINTAIQSKILDLQSLIYVRDELRLYAAQIYGRTDGDGEVDSGFIQNKLTQTFTYLFVSLYASGWESFFDDFLALTSCGGTSARDNLAGVVLYLRIVGSIHDEIADVLLTRSPEVQNRNNELKDLIRERDVQKNTVCWQEILSYWRGRNDVVSELCLKAIARWVGWIDISLVANEAMLTPLFELVGRTQQSDTRSADARIQITAIDTLTEIVSKKMKPADKVQMIYYLNLQDVVRQLIGAPMLQDAKSTSGYDTDLAEAVAKLVNSTAYDIVRTLDDDTIDDQSRSQANELLKAFVPFVLRFFSDDYDEVCSSVITSLTDLLAYFRKEVKEKTALQPDHATMISPILGAILAKMKYDETMSWGEEDEQTDEAEFQELRRRLHVMQQTMAGISETMYLDVMTDVVNNTFLRVRRISSGIAVDWRDVEMALHEIFLFGEVAVKKGGLYSKNQPNSPAAERLVGMLTNMIDSGIASFSHPAVQLQYMEICVRYYTYFEVHPHFIPQVLESFVRFVHHDHVRVKTRSWYLFHRFIKQLRGYLGNVAETVLGAIGDLLVIKAEVPKERSDDNDMSSEDNDQPSDATFNSQLYLFEAVGCVSSTSSVPVDKQVQYAQSVFVPLFAEMERNLQPAKNGEERSILQIHHIIVALGTLAQGYSEWTPGRSSAANAPAAEVSEQFQRCSEAILVALESLRSSFNIRTAARSALSRFIGVLGARILPQLPQWTDGLLAQSSSNDEIGMFLRLLDQVIFGFKTEIYGFLDSLLSPLLQRVFAGLGQPTSGTDDEIQLTELRREYLSFLLVILNNDLGSVLVSSANQNTFDLIISTIEHFAKNGNDLQTAKFALGVLTKMSLAYGGPDIVKLPGAEPLPPSSPTANGAAVASNNTSLPGFSRFMIERFTPVSWTFPATLTFNPKDAQARQVLGEAATLQRTIFAKTGEDFVRYLREVWFPSLRLSEDRVVEFLQALESRDPRGFKTFFLEFIQRIAGSS
ncbi:MAG: pre-tRNA nuclear export protein [Piccolia ochrophora]|nr:MAG: pre-tRNA nuclear export protein [Piccolia ochrophora]